MEGNDIASELSHLAFPFAWILNEYIHRTTAPSQLYPTKQLEENLATTIVIEVKNSKVYNQHSKPKLGCYQDNFQNFLNQYEVPM